MEKRFAITGATGLLGSNLVNRLVGMNIEVSVLIKDENSKLSFPIESHINLLAKFP